MAAVPHVTIAPMAASDALEIERQASQRVQLGLERAPNWEEAAALIEDGESWTVRADGRIVACMGLRETFPPVQGVAWAILATGIGGAHLAITRFARARIAASPLIRIEAIVLADSRAECSWARLVGLEVCAVLRRFGAASADHILFDRVR